MMYKLLSSKLFLLGLVIGAALMLIFMVYILISINLY